MALAGIRPQPLIRPVRVLYATAESHPTYRPDVRVLFGQSLACHSVEVDLLATTEAAGDAPPAPWPGGRALLRAGGSRTSLMWADLVQQLSLLWLCTRGYDALVVRDKPVLGVIGWLAARIARIPFCYWMSYPLPEHYLWLASQRDGRVGRGRRAWLWLRGTLGRVIVSRVLVPRSDWLFVQSDAMHDALRAARTLRHERVTAVPMGVDIDAIPEPAARLPATLEGRPFGVYLGTLDRYRQPEVLVCTAMRVAARRPDFVLLIVGDADEPADRGWLAAYAAEVGASSCVHFTGRLPAHDALALARRASVGLSPVPRTSLTEVGSPTKAIEYLACGIPVVCNDQPDQAYVVRESGGGRVTDFDAEALADAVLATLDEADAARARAASARGWVERHRTYHVLGRLVAERLHAVADSRVPARAAGVGAGR